MGCCPSQTDDKPDEIQQGVQVITTVRQTRPPSRSTASQLQSSSSDSVKDNASQDKPPDASFVPRPPPGKKPSTGSFRRRSGVRLAASLSSDILPVSPTQEVHIPRPPSVKREPSSNIKRRSGVREASSSSSSLEADDQHVTNNALANSSSGDEVLSQPKVSDEEPKVRDSAKVNEEGAVTEQTDSSQSNIDSGFGNSLGESIAMFSRTDNGPHAQEECSTLDETLAVPSRTDNGPQTQEECFTLDETLAVPSRTDNGPQAQEECSTLGEILAVPSRTDNGPQALEGSVVYDDKCLFAEQTQSITQTPTQQPESLGPIDATEDSTNDGAATGAQLREDEKQFLHDTEQKETNEEAFGQTSGLVASSSAHSDASDPSSSVVSATQEPTVQDDEGNSRATNDLEIQKTASSLAIQAIRESLSEETAVMLDTDSNMEVTEVLPTRYVELPAEQSSQVSKSDMDSSDRHQIENALHVKSDNTDSEQPTRAAQEKETAKLHTEGAENNSASPAAELISDSQREADGVAKKPSVKTESSKEETKERQESQEELVVTGKAIAIQKMPMKITSLKDVKSTTSVNKTSSKNAQSTFSKLSQSAAKKVNARQSRSLGTVSSTTDKRFSRTLSLNDVEKSVTGKNNSVMRGEPSFQWISNGAKKLMPIRSESKPRRTENAFTVAKSYQPTKLPPAKGKKAPTLKQASKSLNNLPRTSKPKDVATKKAASLSHAALKSKPENTEQSIKQDANRISGEPSAAALKNDDTEALSDKSSMSMDSDVRLTKAIFEFLDNQETKIEGFTVYKDGVMKKKSKDIISKVSPRRSPSPSIGAPNEKISVDRIPSSSPIRIRSGSSIHSPERAISYGRASSLELSNSLVEEGGSSSRSGSPVQSGDLA